MSSTKIEFAVDMTCDSCVKAVKKSLENVPGIKSFDINLETKSVVVDTNLSTLNVQKKLEECGKKVVVRGHGGSVAGVCILENGDENIKGVIRFVQATKDTCILDGTVDGLNPGKYGISIHECGDVSQGCSSVGDVYNPNKLNNGRVYGEIGTIFAENNGRAAFRLEDNVVKLSDIIGRSFVLRKENDGKRLSCGIIARSAGLFENPKTICACDGITIWDEKILPKSTL